MPKANEASPATNSTATPPDADEDLDDRTDTAGSE